MSSNKLQTFSKLTNIETKYSDEVVNIGYCKPIENFTFIKRFFEQWVASVDSKIDICQKHSVEYADLLSRRGFTFDEFKFLMNGSIPEESYHRTEIFELLYIDDQIEREKFKYKVSGDDLSLAEQYQNSIKQFIKQENPLLKDYLLDTKVPINLSIEALKKHVYILGSSGSGKSELIKHLIYELQRTSHKKRNRSIIYIDPHGDSALDVLRFVMNKGVSKDRVIYLDADLRSTIKQLSGQDLLQSDYHYVVNPFDNKNIESGDIPSFTEYISQAFFSVIDSDETFQMESIIESCVETLIRDGKSDISDLKRFMDDNKNSDLIKLAEKIPNKERAEFITSKFRTDGRLSSTKNSIFIRLQKLLGNTYFQRAFTGQSTVNLEEAMNSGKVIIINMNKAITGKLSSLTAGKLMVALFSAYAFRRVKQTKNKRMDTFLFIDEFQNYVSENINEILAETRKFKLFAVLANQQAGQSMSSQLKRIIGGNTALKFMGDNEPESAEWMASQMKHVTGHDVNRLPKYGFWLNDRFNKSAGSFISRSPGYLVDTSSRYYLNKKETIDLLRYIAIDSGIYRKVESQPIVKSSPKSDILSNPFTE